MSLTTATLKKSAYHQADTSHEAPLQQRAKSSASKVHAGRANAGKAHKQGSSQ